MGDHGTDGPGLVSIGYEGRDPEQLVDILREQRVSVVVDVRLTPQSRKRGLSKRALAERLSLTGIGYHHLPELGNPRENREPFWRGDLAAGRARFRDLLRVEASAAALAMLTTLAEHNRVAVLCFERDHDRCHRQVVIDEVSRRSPALHEVAFV